MTQDQLNQVLLDPANVFANPMAVVNESGISTENKIEILRRWEYDARELDVAVEEGFPSQGPNSQLDAVLAALHCLGTDFQRNTGLVLQLKGINKIKIPMALKPSSRAISLPRDWSCSYASCIRRYLSKSCGYIVPDVYTAMKVKLTASQGGAQRKLNSKPVSQ